MNFAQGGGLRTKVKSMEKHLPLKLNEVREQERMQDTINEMGNVSLRESFNMDLYERPIWKHVDKQKWKDPKGMSYSGQFSEHVFNNRGKFLGGSGLQETSI